MTIDGVLPARLTSRSIVAGLGALAVVVTLTSCGGEADVEPVSTTSASAPTPAVPSPTETTPSPISNASPYSGLPNGLGKPVLAVKIDNTGAAQPHEGLELADLVYVEEVEWGLNRLLAIFSTQMPDVLGPVRSARVSDIDILQPFADVVFAYSGAQSKLLPQLAADDVIDASATASYIGWFDDASRRSPVDHMLRPIEVLGVFPDAAVSKDIGLTFDEEPPPNGSPGSFAAASWADSEVSFSWDEAAGDYVVRMNGNPSRSTQGGSQRAATVVIQSVTQSDSGYGDKFGGITPKIEVVGSGSAVVLRDGKSWLVTWERVSASDGTTFTLADGSPMPFAIGQTWIVLLDDVRTAQVS